MTVLLVEEVGGSSVRVLSRSESETVVVELGDTHNVNEAVYWLGEEIENTVEDHFTLWKARKGVSFRHFAKLKDFLESRELELFVYLQ